MDLFPYYSAQTATMGEARMDLNTGERQHASIAQIEPRSVSLLRGHGISLKYAEENRYVLAKSITFDLLISIYDVNSRSAVVVRPAKPIDRKELSIIEKRINRIKNPNLEIRAIGLQNGWRGYAKSLNDIYKASRSKGHCMEVDLFGNEKRHIALDLKTGLSYNLFLENRIYRPGELINDEKETDFQQGVTPLLFI